MSLRTISFKRISLLFTVVLLLTIGLASTGIGATSLAQSNPPAPTAKGLGGSQAEDGDSGGVLPPPASIGTDVPLTYFGPPPSSVQKELVGPYQLLKAGKVDIQALTVTLPLYKGKLASGETVWYVLTDTNDKANADGLGLNFSAKLSYAGAGRGSRSARLEKDNSLTFASGKVDFSPESKLVKGDGPNAFPPKVAQPGSVADNDYTPLVRLENAGNFIYNAPMVAFNVKDDQLNFCNGKVDHKVAHDKVAKICPKDMTVTLDLTLGFSFDKPIAYLSFDSNDPVAATLEKSTLAPAMSDISVGKDDTAFNTAERIFSFVNGPAGKGNPQRQGLNSAIVDNMSPLNVFGGIPTVATDYSPMWDLNLGVWTPKAIENSYRSRMLDEFTILSFVEQGWITGPDGKPYGSTGILINCPVVYRFL